MNNDQHLVFCKECKKNGNYNTLSVNSEFCPNCHSPDFIPSEEEIIEWRKRRNESVLIFCRGCSTQLSHTPGYDDEVRCYQCGEPQLNSYKTYLEGQRQVEKNRKHVANLDQLQGCFFGGILGSISIFGGCFWAVILFMIIVIICVVFFGLFL